MDRAALESALAAGLPVGGWCPGGRHAEDGTIPARYPLVETPSSAYLQRTEWNVRDSDATFVVGPGSPSPGTLATQRLAIAYGRPLWHLDRQQYLDVDAVQAWMRSSGIQILNVAGPRECECPGIYAWARRVLAVLFESLLNLR